jgi:uncharacterized spore protein YtfJ
MAEQEAGVFEPYMTSLEGLRQINERLIEMAGPKAVFGDPVTQGEYTVITASELFTAVGSAHGFGQGSNELADTTDEADEPSRQAGTASGAGGGGGGGGTVNGRPVAVIIVGPEGVTVEPVVDVTKIGLAFLTTIGAMALMVGRMKRR